MTAELQSEVEKLRGELEAHRQRELAELRSALASASAAAAHYRQEAERNADLGRKIHQQAETTIAELRATITHLKYGATRETFNAGRTKRPAAAARP